MNACPLPRLLSFFNSSSFQITTIPGLQPSSQSTCFTISCYQHDPLFTIFTQASFLYLSCLQRPSLLTPIFLQSTGSYLSPLAYTYPFLSTSLEAKATDGDLLYLTGKSSHHPTKNLTHLTHLTLLFQLNARSSHEFISIDQQLSIRCIRRFDYSNFSQASTAPN